MLLLLFKIGEDSYGINALDVQEVLPHLRLETTHGAPEFVAGIANCRGKLIPVIDIERLFANKKARQRISTRIIVLKLAVNEGRTNIVGVLAENVTDTLKVDETRCQRISIKSKSGAVIGTELLVEDRMIHHVNINELVSAQLYDEIFNHDELHNHKKEISNNAN